MDLDVWLAFVGSASIVLAIPGPTVLVAIVNASGYAVLAGRFHASFRRPHVLRTLNRIGGGVLVGAGIMTAALRRTA
jgi:threonine/homoserine/homoserine lactone efflux protein